MVNKKTGRKGTGRKGTGRKGTRKIKGGGRFSSMFSTKSSSSRKAKNIVHSLAKKEEDEIAEETEKMGKFFHENVFKLADPEDIGIYLYNCNNGVERNKMPIFHRDRLKPDIGNCGGFQKFVEERKRQLEKYEAEHKNASSQPWKQKILTSYIKILTNWLKKEEKFENDGPEHYDRYGID